ncbi:hypothetical protein F5J12DRAFT_784930 [Pisolithus orientalis]|uniref:uncharacterized protein n=1 Tax=Pisolithus orientalis TaxID=936130 RepID=UPI00222408C7|nr:uncharacterized protein F5J12DRAFT_784930 [Pisolithus orientalis]KAI5998346.1 hypothetical protein F5J12DRAFT_784930 [Pisolithus orientalis]
MSTANTSTFIPAQLTDNIQPVITAENAKQMVEEAARVTMQALRGLQGQDAKHWGKAAQLVLAQLGMVHTVVEHLPPAFKIPLHLIAINMHMVDPATIFATQMWPPFNQMMMAQEADCEGSCMPKSHPYYRVMEELTGPSLRAEHQAQLVDKGKGKELGTDEAQGIQLLDAPTDTTARTTGVVMQKPGHEEDQNREKAQGCSQSRCGQPAAKPVDASDHTSRGLELVKETNKEACSRGGETSPRCSKKPPIQGLTGNNPQKTPLAFPPLQHLLHQLHQLSIQSNKPHYLSPGPWTGCPISEEVTILKWENADMRQEIEVTHTELATLHQVVDAIHNHLFPAPDMLNHPLVPFHTTSNPTLVPHMLVMVELGTATGVVEVQSSQSGSRQESTEPPPWLHSREVLAWKYLL